MGNNNGGIVPGNSMANDADGIFTQGGLVLRKSPLVRMLQSA